MGKKILAPSFCLVSVFVCFCFWSNLRFSSGVLGNFGSDFGPFLGWGGVRPPVLNEFAAFGKLLRRQISLFAELRLRNESQCGNMIATRGCGILKPTGVLVMSIGC